MTRSKTRQSIWHQIADILAKEPEPEESPVNTERLRVIAMEVEELPLHKEFLSLCQSITTRLAQSPLDVYDDGTFPKVKYSAAQGYTLPGEWAGDSEPQGRLLDPAAALRGWAQKADAESELNSETTAKLLKDLEMSVVEAKSSLQTRRSVLVALVSFMTLGLVAAVLFLGRAMNPVFMVLFISVGFFFAFRASLPAWGSLKKEEFVTRLEGALRHVQIQRHGI